MVNVARRYRKNESDEKFLEKFNTVLIDIESEYIHSQKPSKNPIFFICGPPRSGTTLITQVLARTGLFNYVDNFVARFWRVPFVGFYLEKIMGLRNSLHNAGHTLESEFGRTSGILDPHEFAYFWEYWLKPGTPHHVIPVSHLKKIDIHGLRNEINAMINLYDKPILFKSIWFLCNPTLAYHLFRKVYFIFITRDLLSNALSILEARKKYYKNENEWFSVRPPSYKELKDEPVEGQIIGQIKGIHDEIVKQTKDFPERIINITYEELCNNPLKTILKITDHFGLKDIDVRSIRQKLPKSFTPKNISCTSERIKRFEEVSKAIEIS